jgi:two-component system, NarL family, response regulator NreC
MISIVLADDHQVVRKGVQALLRNEADFNVIGETSDGLETVKLVEESRPDILVLDLMMGGINGLEVTRQVSKRSPRTGIVILSMHSNEAYVLEALRAGAKAYVLKDNPTDELIHAIREVIVGHRYLSSPLSERAIEMYTKKTEIQNGDPYDQLTTREREILQMAAQACSNAEIAEKLFISPRTVETHRANLMRKLNLHNNSQLLQYAMKKGIIPEAG